MSDTVCTTCPYCGTGCGVVASHGSDGWAVGGDPDHPANHGRLCSKGMALLDPAPLAERLLQPEINGQQTGWKEALDEVAMRLDAVRREHGPKSIGFYVSGQLLTEDYYVVNKFAKGFLGTPHIDTNSRLCMASSVVGHKRAFGGDIVPGCYEDLEQADLVVLAGSNLAWCHPVLFQRLRAAQKKNGCRVVVIDPRRTASCDGADLHLAIRPGTDVILWNGLLRHLDNAQALDKSFLNAHVTGWRESVAAAHADAGDDKLVAALCRLPVEDIRKFYALFTASERSVTLYSQGVNQSSSGVDKVNAITNAHLATGRIGKPGMGPFSVTGQPNAMGGREVGGLANQLAAHMDPNSPADVARVKRFWKAPALQQGEGYKAIDLFRAVAKGEIKALWIMATNPAVSLPEAELVREALKACPLVIVSDMAANTDTQRYAHIKLPALAWGEKDGTVTNSERRISRQRPFLAGPEGAKADWWIVSQVACRLGFKRAFGYRRPADIFREHAALSAYENFGTRAFNIGRYAKVSNADYEGLAPFQWPCLPRQDREGTKRLFTDGRFFTPDGHARMLPLRFQTPKSKTDARHPLLLNTGRLRDQWHTMTRTGFIPRLGAHRPEPLLDMHPEDAEELALEDGDLAWIENQRGHALLRLRVTDNQKKGEVFAPIHWTDDFTASGIIDRLVGGHTDSLSGQPESKITPVRVTAYRASWAGVLLTRRKPDLKGAAYWCRYAGEDCWIYDLADQDPVAESVLIRELFTDPKLTRLDYLDRAKGNRRFAWMADERLEACLFLSRERPAIARDWLNLLFAQGPLSLEERALLLAGRAPNQSMEKGRIVCSCHQVGLNAITEAIASGAAQSVEQIGSLLSAGTGCGSCQSELKSLIEEYSHDQSAA